MPEFISLDDMFNEHEKECRDLYQRDLENGTIEKEWQKTQERMAAIDWDAIQDCEDEEEEDEDENDDDDVS